MNSSNEERVVSTQNLQEQAYEGAYSEAAACYLSYSAIHNSELKYSMAKGQGTSSLGKQTFMLISSPVISLPGVYEAR